MADKVIFEIEINGDLADKTLTELQGEVKRLETLISKNLVSGTEDYERAIKELGKVRTVFEDQRKTIQQTGKEAKVTYQAIKEGGLAGAKSVSQLRDVQKALVKELENVERGSDEYKQLAGQVRIVKGLVAEYNEEVRVTPSFTEKLAKAIKEVGTEAGKTEQNIVILNQSITDLSTQRTALDPLSAEFQQLTNQINEATQALQKANSTADKSGAGLGKVGGVVKGVGAGMDKFGEATGAANGGFAELTKTMLKNPFVFIAAAIIAIIGYFSKFRIVTDFLSDAMAVLDGVMIGIRDSLKGLGNTIKAVFSFITGDIEGASKAWDDATKNFADAGETVEAMLRINQALREVERSLGKNEAGFEAAKGAAERFKAQAEDTSLTVEKRAEAQLKSEKLLREAYREREILLERQAALANEQIAIQERYGLVADDVAERAKEANLQLVQFQNEAAMLRQDLDKAERERQQAALDAQKAAAEAALAAALAAEDKRVSALSLKEDQARLARLTSQEQYELNLQAIEDESGTRRVAILKKFGQDSTEVLRKQAEARISLIAAQEAAAAAEVELVRENAAADAQKAEDERERARVENLQSALADAQLAEDQYENVRLNRLKEHSVTADQVQEDRLQSNLLRLQKQQEAEQAAGESTLSTQNEIIAAQIDYDNFRTDQTRKEIERIQAVAAAEQAASEARINATVAVGNAIIALVQTSSEGAEAAAIIGKAVLLFEKAGAIAKIVIDSSAARAAAVLAAAPFGVLGLPLLAAQESVITANEIGNIASVVAATIPSFIKMARGGLVDGPSHAQGGVKIYGQVGAPIAEVEGGEAVLTKGVSQDPRLLSIASAVNELAGGIPFARGGYLPSAKMAQGGVVLSGTMPLPDTALLQEIKSLREDFQNIRPVVSVEEFNKTENRVQLLENNRTL